MRITEEQDRRRRDEEIRQRLPRALDELQQALGGCLESYTEAFGAPSAAMEMDPTRIAIVIRDEQDGQWQERTRIEVAVVPAIPGFQVDLGHDEPLVIEVGMLPGEKLFYRDRSKDQYVGMDEVTHRILDRALFPKLRE